jgi:hypothetical protein
MVTWPHALGQNIMEVEAHGRVGSYLMADRGRDQGPDVTFKSTPPGTSSN